MNRTDLILRKIVDKLEESRTWLDNMPGVRSVTIDIKMVEKTGLPRVVIIRTESESD